MTCQHHYCTCKPAEPPVENQLLGRTTFVLWLMGGLQKNVNCYADHVLHTQHVGDSVLCIINIHI